MNQHTARNSYFINLDAFRFFSFLGVFFSHTLLFPASANMGTDFFLSLVTMTCLGVPFFFTLSSFLITYRLLSEKERKGTIHLLGFYKNRILRIWPAYYLLVIICFLLMPLLANLLHMQAPSLPPILPFLLFYANFYMIEHGVAFTFALTILWSISIEEQFYLVWGWLLRLLSRHYLAIVILLLFLCSIVFSYYYLHVLQNPAYNLAIHSMYVLQNFCAGAWMALICFQKQKLFRFLASLPAVAPAAVYIILPVGYFFIKDIVLLNMFKSICYSLIIYDQCFNERRFFNAGKFALVNYLGKISYGLYLYHALVFVILQKAFNFFTGRIISTGNNLLETAITFILTCFVAHISYRFIESKFLALKTV